MYVYFVPMVIVVFLVVVVFSLLRRGFRKNIVKQTETDSDKANFIKSGVSGTLAEERLLLEAADSYEKAGRTEKAIENYELYLYKSDSEDPAIFYKLGNLYGLENQEKANYYWEKAAKSGYQPAIDRMDVADKSPK